MEEPRKLIRTDYNEQWVDAGRKAGFTDEQLVFLEDFHMHEGCEVCD